MSTSIVIADVLTAIMWPLIVLTILFLYRKKFPVIAEGLASRVTKLEFAGVGLELAIAKPYQPDSEKIIGSSEFWHKASHILVNDSYATTFFNQLTEGGPADYAEINLSKGESWLTSRLYIISILYAQMKGVKAFVFVENAGKLRKHYIGLASPDTIRWALGRRYPWLETSYVEAYKRMLIAGAQFVPENGRLGDVNNPGSPYKSISLLKEFLQLIQTQITPSINDTKEWTSIDATTPNFEHAVWMNGELLEKTLGPNLNTTYLRSSELRSKTAKEQLALIVPMSGPYIAVTTDDYRFEYLLNRTLLLEQQFLLSKV